ncbi:hypothetical protein M3223_16870 [Paenibacillus pasadenensis]|uniref:hypothetical protein n=1 Tax=Paenibacillus pasadenensis TaxID=217090 RepID=UPI00203C9878|nr:hypothetical protein [Paenibacillus pasadenensis]MCM3749030.1 hypothetical protein [Paenibacillus pasadenensis]
MSKKVLFAYAFGAILLVNVFVVMNYISDEAKTVNDITNDYTVMINRIHDTQANIEQVLNNQPENSELLLYQADSHIEEANLNYQKLMEPLITKNVPLDGFNQLIADINLFVGVVLAERLNGKKWDRNRLNEVNQMLLLLEEALPKALEKDSELPQLRQAFAKLDTLVEDALLQ